MNLRQFLIGRTIVGSLDANRGLNMKGTNLGKRHHSTESQVLLPCVEFRDVILLKILEHRYVPRKDIKRVSPGTPNSPPDVEISPNGHHKFTQPTLVYNQHIH